MTGSYRWPHRSTPSITWFFNRRLLDVNFLNSAKISFRACRPLNWRQFRIFYKYAIHNDYEPCHGEITTNNKRKNKRLTFFVYIDAPCQSMMNLTADNCRICVVLHFNARDAVRMNVAFFEVSHAIPENEFHSRTVRRLTVTFCGTHSKVNTPTSFP